MEIAWRLEPFGPYPAMTAHLPAAAMAQWDRSHDALVLIVEDETEIADIIAAYLEREKLRVVRASDGRTALELHRSARPDLVLLDVQLPGIDGWGVLSQLRQGSDTPIIMLTALDQDLDKLTALRMGADDYVVKPFNPAEVAARVRAVLRRTLRSAPRTAGVHWSCTAVPAPTWCYWMSSYPASMAGVCFRSCARAAIRRSSC